MFALFGRNCCVKQIEVIVECLLIRISFSFFFIPRFESFNTNTDQPFRYLIIRSYITFDCYMDARADNLTTSIHSLKFML